MRYFFFIIIINKSIISLLKKLSNTFIVLTLKQIGHLIRWSKYLLYFKSIFMIYNLNILYNFLMARNKQNILIISSHGDDEH